MSEHPIERARRNLAYVESSRSGSVQGQARLEMAAFLDFMHPEMDEDRKRVLIRSAGEVKA